MELIPSAARLHHAFDQQAANLLQKGYPAAVGLDPAAFSAHIDPLRDLLDTLALPDAAPAENRVPFVIVIKSELIPADRTITQVERAGKSGFTVLKADELKTFTPIERVTPPQGMAYLLLDVDTGTETLNITPTEALKMIHAAHRSPLTIDEGIALVTHYPDILRKNHGFSLAGSRCGDRRVTALWISKNTPKLGWCWAGNPHTWLGTASCGGRLGA